MFHLPGNGVIHDLERLTGFLVALALKGYVGIVDKLKVFRVIHYPIAEVILFLQRRVIGGNVNDDEHAIGGILSPRTVSAAPRKGMFNPGDHLFTLLFLVIVVFRVCVPVRNVLVLVQAQTRQDRKIKFIIKTCAFPVAAQNRCGKLWFGFGNVFNS